MINPKALEDILDVLIDKGITKFTCPEFSCELGPQQPEEVDDLSTAIDEAKAVAAAPRAARGLFGHPKLWPNGVPPSFPGSERATPTHVPTHSDED